MGRLHSFLLFYCYLLNVPSFYETMTFVQIIFYERNSFTSYYNVYAVGKSVMSL
jgi:hypothetical protein